MNTLQKIAVRNLNILAVRGLAPSTNMVLRHKKSLGNISVSELTESGLSDRAKSFYFADSTGIIPVSQDVTPVLPDVTPELPDVTPESQDVVPVLPDVTLSITPPKTKNKKGV